MAGQTFAVTGTLESGFSFDFAFKHVTGMAGFTLLDLHIFRIGHLFTVFILGVMAYAALQFLLMLGMGKFNRFFPMRINDNFRRSFVYCGGGHAGQAYAAEKCQCYATDECLFHAFLLTKKKNRVDYHSNSIVAEGAINFYRPVRPVKT